MKAIDNRWPVVTVMICTYDRPFELGSTFGALTKNLHYPNLHWHLADDGSPKASLDAAIEHIEPYVTEARGETFSYSVTNRKGWGANVNFASQMLAPRDEFVYFTEDDHVLKRPLDLRPYVALLIGHENIGMVRFGIAGHDGIRARLREYDIDKGLLPDYSEAIGYGCTGPGRMNAWELALGHTENWGPYGFWRYSNRPHLKHRRFHAAYGFYQEGKTLGETEQAMNHTIEAVYRNSEGRCPAIVVPCEWTYWYYDHIGQSRQGTEEDIHA